MKKLKGQIAVLLSMAMIFSTFTTPAYAETVAEEANVGAVLDTSVNYINETAAALKKGDSWTAINWNSYTFTDTTAVWGAACDNDGYVSAKPDGEKESIAAIYTDDLKSITVGKYKLTLWMNAWAKDYPVELILLDNITNYDATSFVANTTVTSTASGVTQEFEVVEDMENAVVGFVVKFDGTQAQNEGIGFNYIALQKYDETAHEYSEYAYAFEDGNGYEIKDTTDIATGEIKYAGTVSYNKAGISVVDPKYVVLGYNEEEKWDDMSVSDNGIIEWYATDDDGKVTGEALASAPNTTGIYAVKVYQESQIDEKDITPAYLKVKIYEQYSYWVQIVNDATYYTETLSWVEGISDTLETSYSFANKTINYIPNPSYKLLQYAVDDKTGTEINNTVVRTAWYAYNTTTKEIGAKLEANPTAAGTYAFVATYTDEVNDKTYTTTLIVTAVAEEIQDLGCDNYWISKDEDSHYTYTWVKKNSSDEDYYSAAYTINSGEAAPAPELKIYGWSNASEAGFDLSSKVQPTIEWYATDTDGNIIGDALPSAPSTAGTYIVKASYTGNKIAPTKLPASVYLVITITVASSGNNDPGNNSSSNNNSGNSNTSNNTSADNVVSGNTIPAADVPSALVPSAVAVKDGKIPEITFAPADEKQIVEDYTELATLLKSKSKSEVVVSPLSAALDNGRIKTTFVKGKVKKLVVTSYDGTSNYIDVTVTANTKLVLPAVDKNDTYTITYAGKNAKFQKAGKFKAKYNNKMGGAVLTPKASKDEASYVLECKNTTGTTVVLHVVNVSIDKAYGKYTLSSKVTQLDGKPIVLTVTPANGAENGRILTGVWTYGKNEIITPGKVMKVNNKTKCYADVELTVDGILKVSNAQGKGTIKLTYTVNGKKYATKINITNKDLTKSQEKKNAALK